MCKWLEQSEVGIAELLLIQSQNHAILQYYRVCPNKFWMFNCLSYCSLNQKIQVIFRQAITFSEPWNVFKQLCQNMLRHPVGEPKEINAILPVLNNITLYQASSTKKIKTKCKRLLNYVALHPNIVLQYHASNMHLHIDLDAAYIVAPKVKSRIVGFYYFKNSPSGPLFNYP